MLIDRLLRMNYRIGGWNLENRLPRESIISRLGSGFLIIANPGLYESGEWVWVD